MAYELGVAYLPIVAETSKLSAGIKAAMGDATRGAEREGRKAGGMLSTGLKRTVKTGLAGGALFAGVAAKKGIDRLLGIEDARASLSGLGHDAKSIDAIMGNALEAVRGTAFGMADAGKVAASAVAAGVKPGGELERTLKLVGDAATIAKTDMGSMGAVFNKVSASNKLQMDSINQLHDAGVPALQLVAEELGVTAEEASKMASAGKIDFATFQDAMEKGMGGAALKSGETTRGAFANMLASVGRVGANLLGGVFPKFREFFGGITNFLGPLEEKAATAGEALGGWLSRVGGGLRGIYDVLAKGDFTAGLRESFGWAEDSRPVDFLFDLRDGAIGLYDIFVKGDFTSNLRRAFGFAEDSQAVGFMLGVRDGVIGTGKALKQGFLSGLDAAQGAFGWMANNKATVATFFGVIAGGIVIFKTITGVMKVLAAVQAAWNALILANPIGIAVVALAAFAAGLVYAYRKSETFRNVVNAVWSGIRTAFSAAWSFIAPILSSVASWVGERLPAVFAFLKTAVGVAFTIIGTYFKVWWTVVKAVFSVVKWYVTTVLAPVFSWLWANIIKPVFGWIGKHISTVWNGVIKPAFSTLRSGVSKVGSAFSAAKDVIQRGWGKLGEIVSGPINLAKRAIGGFIDLINGIPGLPDIPNPFRGKAPDRGGSRGGRHRGQTAFATGGAVFGPGSGTSDSIMARLSNGEHVLTAQDVRNLGGQAKVYALRAAAAAGQFHMPGFAAGGAVVPGRGNRHTSGYPWATYAGDFPNPIGTPVKAWKSGLIAKVQSLATSYGKHIRMNHSDNTSSLYAHLSRFAVEAGERVRQGATIGYVGSTGNSTGPHLHLETMGGQYSGGPGGGGGSIWDTLKGAAGRIGGWIKSKLLDKANIGGLFGNVSGLFRSIGNGVKGYVTDKLFDSGGLSSGKGLMVKNTLSPERVLSPRQTAAFESALARGFGPGGRGEPRLHVIDAQIDDGFIRVIAREEMVDDRGLDAELYDMGGVS